MNYFLPHPPHLAQSAPIAVYKPSNDYYHGQELSDLVSEKEKGAAPYLIAKADDLISRLVTSRPDLRLARNLFEGRRDPNKLAHLTDNYGIGNPGKIPFINLMRNRVQVIKGKFLEAGIPHQIGCTDSISVGTLEQERFEFGMKEFVKALTADLGKRMQVAAQGQEPGAPEGLGQARLKELSEQLDEFQSSIEIQSQEVLTELIENPEVLMVPKLEQHLENFLVEGSSNFVTIEGEPGLLPDHEVVPAGELYTDAPSGDRTLDKATAYVRRQLIPKQTVLTTYGQYLSREECRTILGDQQIAGPWNKLPMGGEKYLDFYETNADYSDAYRGWIGTLDGSVDDLVEVFTVRWKACNPVSLSRKKDAPKIPAGAQLSATGATPDQQRLGAAGQHLVDGGLTEAEDVRWREDIYEVVVIGDNIYPTMGRVEDPVRPINKPWSAMLGVRGYRLDVSLVLQCEDLQEKSDVMHYFAENIVANSGTKGSMMPINDIPTELGEDPIERMMQLIGYRKQGIIPINPMQAGGTKGQFSNYQNYDDTLNGQALDGIKTFLEFYDEVASNITGINRQMLGAIAERDGKATTEQAVVGATLITKPIYALFDRLTGDALTDLLNACRRSFASASGTVSRLTLGEAGRRIFTIDAKKFALAQYRVYVKDGREEKQQMADMKALGVELVKGQLLPAEEAVEMMFAKSVTGTKKRVIRKLREKEASNTAQLQQQVEELTKQLEQRTKELQGFDQAEQQREGQRLQLETKDVAIDQQRANTEAALGWAKDEKDGQRVALERDQAISNAAPQSAEIKNK